MKKQVIVAFSSEYGSDGHYIAETIAKDLGIEFYDRNMMEEIAKKMNMEADELAQYDEKRRNPLLTRTVRGFTNSIEEALAQKQFEFMRQKADKGTSFVIYGRCGEWILRGRDNLVSVFVLADKEDKVKRVAHNFSISEKEAAAKMSRHDTKRKRYHNDHSGIKWGDSRGYDMCINSSRLGVDGTIKLLENYIKDRHLGTEE